MFNPLNIFRRKQEPSYYFKFAKDSQSQDWAPVNWPVSGFQTDLPGCDQKQFGPVFSCVQIISQEIAKLPIIHYRVNDDGSKTKLKGTVAQRVLRKPNQYQTRSEFWLFIVNSLLYRGNGFGYCRRNARREIDAIIPVDANGAHPHVDPRTRDLYYRLGGNCFEIISAATVSELIPARDIFHLKTYTPHSPFVGVTPITAAAYSANLGISIEKNSAAFFENMARPSGVLKVPGKIGKEARARLREAWKEAYSGEKTGNIGVLSDNAEWQPITMTAQDAAIVQQHNMTIEDVARVFRVPLFMLGDLEKSTFNNVESTLKFFYSGALSFYLEHIEAQLHKLFMLPDNEQIQFDFEANLRTETLARIEALAAGTAGGIYKVNEARGKEGLPKIPGGENVFIQNQMQTVEDRANNTPLTPAAEPTPTPEPTEDITEDEAKQVASLITKAIENEF